MKTKFTFWAFLILILIVPFLFLIILIVPGVFISTNYSMPIFPRIFLPSMLIFSFILLFFGELRTKCIIVSLNKNEIVVKRFFGIFTKTFKNSEIDGWKYSHLAGKGGTYEYLYLYSSGNKVAKISQYYHRNYFKIKNNIQGNFKYLGYEKFSYINELKELFK